MSTIEWLAFFVLLVAALAAGAAISLSNGAMTRAIRRMERTYRRQKALELEQLQTRAVAQRRMEVEALLTQPQGWQTIIGQLLSDALPEMGDYPAQTDVIELSTTPAPRFTVAGANSNAYLFTTSPEELRRVGILKRREQPLPLDAGLHPAARVEIQAVWEHLAQQRLRENTPMLPRQAEWFLVAREMRRRPEQPASRNPTSQRRYS
jgi:hypothetical protein